MDAHGRWPVIHAGGKPFERGHVHGEQARARIDVTVETYRRFFEFYSGWTWEEAQQRAAAYIPLVESVDPEIMEEIRGVAAGTGRHVLELMAVNARTELGLHPQSRGFHFDRGDASVACTSIAALPEATAAGNTLIGQNADWKASLDEALIILRIDQPDPKPNIVMLTEAGMIARFGFNSAGIGILINGLYSDQTQVAPPINALLRGVLDSTHLGAAVGKLSRNRRSSAMNYLLASSDGEAIDLETSVDGLDYVLPEDGLLTHTNHFTSQRLRVRDLGIVMWPDTIVRGDRVRRLVQKERGRITAETIQQVLSNHAGYPGSICRHLDPADEDRQIHTMASMIFDLAAKTMYVAEGRPCEKGYRKLDFATL